MITPIPAPAYTPDQDSAAGGLSEATNLYARVDGYGPLADFASVSEALPAAFKGGASFIANDGTSYLLAGTAAGLEKYNSGAWTNLETGMTVADQWRFAQFGNYAIGVNGDTTKVVDLVAGTSSTLTGAPAGKSIAIVGDYVVIGQGAGELLNIYTSAFNDHTGWTPGVDQSTIQPMLTGGEVMGLAGGEYGVILQRQRLVRMNRTGDPTAPFSYDPITENVGCASRGSVVSVGRSVFFLSDRGFMALEDGQALRPLGSEKIDRTFQTAVPREDYERLFAAVDPQNKVIIWCVPGSPGKLWIYNFELDRWTTAELVVDGIFSGFSSSLTLEGVSAVYPDIDAMPYSLDDPRFQGGAPRLYLVQSGELGVMSGSTMATAIGFSFSNLGGKIARLRGVRPVSDCLTGQTVTLDVRARLGDAANLKTAGSIRDSGTMPVRASGRYVKPRWTTDAGAVWTFLQALELEWEAGGER